jgi:hypothetical protein
MGWSNCHLYSFAWKGLQYLDPTLVEEPFGDWRDVRSVRLADVGLKEGSRLRYLYDFGDGWEHVLAVESVDPVGEDAVLPRCLKGRRACPPEDCGGPPGYAHVVETLRDGSDPELLQWLPPDFDPERFDLDEVNEILRDSSRGDGNVFDFPGRRPR